MSTRILQIDSSLFGEQGQSTQLSRYLVNQLAAQGPVDVTVRNLAANPLPHLEATTLAAIATPAEQRSESQNAAVAMADAVINEVVAADVVILAAPMYNFGVPSTVKAWMDYLARAGVTFRYTETGPVGLLDAKKVVYIVSPRGGMHVGKPSDSQTAFVAQFFAFLGLTDVRWIYAEGVNMGDHKATALSEAKKAIDAYVAAV